MSLVFYFLASFGLAFWVGNRIPALHHLAARPGWIWGKLRVFLDCQFCQGLWAGGLIWLESWRMGSQTVIQDIIGHPPDLLGVCFQGVNWSLACAMTYSILYVGLVWLEGNPVDMTKVDG